MQSLSELIDETPPDRLRDNASPDAQRMCASATAEEAPPTAPPRRIAPSTQDALEAAEHGDARALAAYLEAGGDPAATSRLHHMGWSLLHLAAGCALAGGPGAAYDPPSGHVYVPFPRIIPLNHWPTYFCPSR